MRDIYAAYHYSDQLSRKFIALMHSEYDIMSRPLKPSTGLFQCHQYLSGYIVAITAETQLQQTGECKKQDH